MQASICLNNLADSIIRLDKLLFESARSVYGKEDLSAFATSPVKLETYLSTALLMQKNGQPLRFWDSHIVAYLEQVKEGADRTWQLVVKGKVALAWSLKSKTQGPDCLACGASTDDGPLLRPPGWKE